MIQIFKQLLQAGTMFSVQSRQYKFCVPITDTVPASSQKLCKAHLSVGHLLCQTITGSYETLSGSGATYDDGICHLRGRFMDGNGQKLLFDGHIPFDLFLTPGRRRSATALNNLLDVEEGANRADPTNGLFYPFEFQYLFPHQTDILFDVINDSDVELSFDVLLSGYCILP